MKMAIEYPNPKGRVLMIDYGRGLSVFFMIMVHTLWMYGTYETQFETNLGHAIHFIGMGTGMFLVSMGFSFMISGRQTLSHAFKRGLILLGAGYLMNLLKFVLPIMIGFMPEDFITAYSWKSPLAPQQYMFLFLTGDILQMAGLSMMIMGVIRKYFTNKYVYLLFAAFFILATRILNGIKPNFIEIDYSSFDFLFVNWSPATYASFLIDYCFNLFFSAKGVIVYFPVFPWISFMLVGMFFGRWYLEKDKNQFFIFNMMLPAGILLMAVGLSLCFLKPDFPLPAFLHMGDFEWHFYDFFHLGPGGALYLIGINFIFYWMIYTGMRIVPLFLVTWKLKFLYFCSEHVTTLYVIQWTVICWGMGIIGFQKFDSKGVLMLIPVFMAVTFAIEFARQFVMKKLKK